MGYKKLDNQARSDRLNNVDSETMIKLKRQIWQVTLRKYQASSASHNLVWLVTIGLVGRVFANGPGDLGSIPGCVIPKTLKMVLDTALLITQQYKIYIKDKVEESRERSSALPYTLV